MATIGDNTKYFQVGNDYYGIDQKPDTGNPGDANRVSYRPTLAKTSLEDIRGLMGDKPADFDFNKTLETMRNNGEIQQFSDLATLTNAAKTKGYGVPGAFGQTGEIPQSQTLQRYLDSTGQTYQNNQFTKGGVASQYMGGIGGQNVSPFESGFNKTQNEGVKNPGTAGEARNIINTYADMGNQNPEVDSKIQQDPYLQQLLNDRNNLVNADNSRTSLIDNYNQWADKLGIDKIDARMVDINKIMSGSEEAIRNEITAAGGFATDRQVLAMNNAANKQLLTEYKDLKQQKTAAEKYLTTMMGLEEKDRAAADARYKEISGLDKQIADYSQKIQDANYKKVEFLQKTVGWKGLLDAYGADDYHMGLLEKTTGLSRDQIASLAQNEIPSTSGQTEIQKEYDYAKTQGYKGDFLSYQKYKATQYGTENPKGKKDIFGDAEDIIQQYKDNNVSRETIEKQYSDAGKTIPVEVQQALDKIYPKTETTTKKGFNLLHPSTWF